MEDFFFLLSCLYLPKKIWLILRKKSSKSEMCKKAQRFTEIIKSDICQQNARSPLRLMLLFGDGHLKTLGRDRRGSVPGYGHLLGSDSPNRIQKISREEAATWQHGGRSRRCLRNRRPGRFPFLGKHPDATLLN